MIAPLALALSAFRIPPRLSAVDWVESNVYLPESSGARGSRYRFSEVPYLRGIVEALDDPTTRRLVVCKGAQQGASTALTAFVLSQLSTRPCPILWVAPTTAQVTTWAKGPLSEILRRTPALARVVNAPKKRGNPGSALLTKLVPGGALHCAGGNSPNSFAALAARVVVLDDCDRVPVAVSEEGDPVLLAEARTTSFPDSLCVFVSTPVLSTGRVESLYARTDRRRYFMTCPSCSRSDFATWSDPAHWFVKFDGRDPETARLRCPCGADVEEKDRMTLVRGGEWKPTAEPETRGHVGFRVPSILSGFVTLRSLVEKFLAATSQHSPMALKEFVNLVLAEGFRDETKTMGDDAALLARMEEW